jgi:hypothetical protein
MGLEPLGLLAREHRQRWPLLVVRAFGFGEVPSTAPVLDPRSRLDVDDEFDVHLGKARPSA